MRNVNTSQAKRDHNFITVLSKAGFFTQCLGNYLQFLERKNRADFNMLIDQSDIKSDLSLLRWMDRKIFNVNLEFLSLAINMNLYERPKSLTPKETIPPPADLRNAFKTILGFTDEELMKFLVRFRKLVETDQCLLGDQELVSGNRQAFQLLSVLRK
jgi:hypothetical protein